MLFQSVGFRWVNAANFLDGLCYFGMLPLLILFLQSHFGVDDQQAGQIFSYYVGLVTLLMFPGGVVCDRLGSRRALTLALCLLGVGRTGLVVAAQAGAPLVVALAALTLMATGTGIVQPSVYAAVKEYTQGPPSTLSAGFAWLYAIMNLGTVVWFLISPSIRAWGGMDGVYLVLALLTWMNAGLLFLFFRQPPLQLAERQPFQLTGLLNLRFVVFICLLVPVRNLVAHLNLSFPPYIERVHPAVEPSLEYFFALHNSLLFLATPLLTRLLSGWNLLSLMILGSSLSALSCIGFWLPGGVAGLIFFVVLFSLGEAIWQARFYEHVAHTAPSGRVGAAMSLANFPWFLTKTTAGFYSGALLAKFVGDGHRPHPENLWLLYGAVAILTPAGLGLLWKWLNRVSHTSKERS